MDEKLKNAQCFLLDLDGTVYHDDDVIDGAIEAVERMRKRGRVMFLTNNSSLSGADYLAKLTRLGFNPTADEILTAGIAAIEYVKKTYPNGRVYLLGSDSFRDEAEASGLNLVTEKPDVVLVCYDTEATFAKFERACDFVFDGVPYVASHPDVACPKKGGMKPDVGSFVALISTATGVPPAAICGKPYSIMADSVRSRVTLPNDKIAMFGDRLQTDIEFGLANGFTSVLVMTGAATEAEVEAWSRNPDVTLESIADWDK